MLVLPQLRTGALAQSPILKQRRRRTVLNKAADGHSYKLADPAGEITEWQLTYECLDDDEAARLEHFFIAAEGRLNGFTFVDPSGNLLAWTEQLDQEVWERGPLLSVAAEGLSTGNARIWRIGNGGLAPQSIAQTIKAPGQYVYTFSAFARSDSPAAIGLSFAQNRANTLITDAWQRVALTGAGDPASASIRFELEIPAGASIRMFGVQAEPQPGASPYKASVRGGVYEGARLTGDDFSITTTDVNRHSCTLNIIHANHS